jgi:aromatic-L-amino-acid decarboxylase
MHEPSPQTGPDMDPEEFRRHGYAVVDWIAGFLREPERYPVLAQVRPGDVAARLPESPPAQPEPVEAILRDFEEIIVPGTTHWNHPGFFAYFANGAAAPGILGEMLAAAVNGNAMLWRTGPAQTELEERSLDWLRQMMGLPEGFHGTIQDTASVSTLVAVAAARHRAAPETHETGMSGAPRLRLYCSEEAHSSVDKAGLVLGIGREGTRRIPTDERFRMDPAVLERAIEEDRAAGWMPFCVVASVGTTSTTSIDPVPEIADVCERQGLWLHVDAAYGGSAATVPEMRWVLEGCERADSLVVNPHKWLFVPMDLSALYFRDPQAVRAAFSLVPVYLSTPEQESVTNLMDFGPALGRRFRALKLWMTLRAFGAEGIAARIREHLRLARLFAAWVEAEPGWEVMAPIPFALVLYRHAPAGMSPEEADAHNARIMDAVNATGEAFVSHTAVRGRLALRLSVGNVRTEERHVRRVWELLREAAAKV